MESEVRDGLVPALVVSVVSESVVSACVLVALRGWQEARNFVRQP